MKKFKYIILILIIFILQSLNIVWCITNPNINNYTTYFALFVDGFIFVLLVIMSIKSK